MPLLPRTGGLHGKPLEDITFIEFQKRVCEKWFNQALISVTTCFNGKF